MYGDTYGFKFVSENQTVFYAVLLKVQRTAFWWFYRITFTTLLANSADDKLNFFLLFPENMFWHFIQIVPLRDL